MIRRAGENIAAREVEAVLAALPEVVEAAARPGARRDARRGGQGLRRARSRRFARATCLPSASSPIARRTSRASRFRDTSRTAPSLPKTPSGKIAKNVLTEGRCRSARGQLRSGGGQVAMSERRLHRFLQHAPRFRSSRKRRRISTTTGASTAPARKRRCRAAEDGDPARISRHVRQARRAHVVIKARDLETTFGFRIANEDVAAFCKATRAALHRIRRRRSAQGRDGAPRARARGEGARPARAQPAVLRASSCGSTTRRCTRSMRNASSSTSRSTSIAASTSPPRRRWITASRNTSTT